jgi:hypothetical protein
VDPNEVAPAADPRRFAQSGGQQGALRGDGRSNRDGTHDSPAALEETVRGASPDDGPPPRLVEESVGDASEISKPVVPAEVSRRPTHDVDDTFKPYTGGGASSQLHKSDSDASLTDLGPGLGAREEAAGSPSRRRAQSVTHGAFDAIPRVESIAASSFAAGRNRANTVSGTGGLADDRTSSLSLWPSQRDRSSTGPDPAGRPAASANRPASAGAPTAATAADVASADDDPW